MSDRGKFQPSTEERDELVRRNPFGLVISSGDGMPLVTPLPLLLMHDEAGSFLLGHFAKTNPMVEVLRASPQALFVFQGPHGYISPSWLGDRTQAPTWNFTLVKYEADVTFGDEREAREAVELLTTAMENARHDAWEASELGARYERLVRGIVPFRARVRSHSCKFKLGQNERLDVLTDMLDGLIGEGAVSLHAAMVAANRARLATAS